MKHLLATAALAALTAAPALAQDAASCAEVSFSDVGWTDITATTALATTVLEALGYQPEVKILSVPVTLTSLGRGDIDVFLGNWMPSQTAMMEPYLADETIDVVRKNLTGAKYTLATLTPTAEQGLTDYSNITEFADELDNKIYGIEPGNEGNMKIARMIENDEFGLGDFEVVESSEQAMLAQADRAAEAGEPIVFLAWEPHPMNTNLDITYLSGGDEIFGPNYGGAEVYTLTRKGYVEECPNVGAFLNNLEFTLDMENQVMGLILDENQAPGEAAKAWLSENPDVLDGWLEGVTTLQGEEGLPAVKEALGI